MPKIASGAATNICKRKAKKYSFEGGRVIDYRLLTVMQYRSNKTRSSRALTLLEMVIAMAIMAIVFAAVLPQFTVIQNSWDSKEGASEALQNGRVLIDHLNQNLSKALRITAVSDSSETNGYIEFQNNDANNVRYDIGVNNYVEFGPVGSLWELAGPVSKLQFTCYDAFDLSTPITDVNAIRSVKVETTLTNLAKLDQNMAFSTQAYIRTNALPAASGDISKMSDPWLEFDLTKGIEPALVHMSGTKYLCAYRGDREDGYACIFTVNPADWSVSAASFLEYDIKQGMSPALAKIDDTNFLCAYNGYKSNGFACILYESTPGVLAVGPVLEFDTAACYYPTLCQIDTQGDTHHYLCTYGDADNPSSAHALVLTINIGSWTITNGPSISFVGGPAPTTALAKIDETHYLCAYEGETGNDHGAAVVLTVNTGDWTITTETHYDFLGEFANKPALAKINDTHYLCAYQGPLYEGRAVVLTVNPADWSITKETSLDIDTKGRDPELCHIDNTSFLCAYWGPGEDGMAVVLTVNISDWTISKGMPFTFAASGQMPALCQIDVGHYLCAYKDWIEIGYDGVLELSSGGILP